MKIKPFYFTFALIAIFFTNCKKDSALKPVLSAQLNNSAAAVLAASGVPVNSVFTVAGKPYISGPTLVNGDGATARFYYPYGIQLMDDGTVFVADSGNNIIRQITPTGNVSSFNIPDRTYVDPVLFLNGPKYVSVDKNGAVFIIDHETATNHDRLMVFSSMSGIIGGDGSDYYDAKDLVKDPYENAFWSISGSTIKKITAKTAQRYIVE